MPTVTTVTGQGTVPVTNPTPALSWTASAKLTLTATSKSVYSIWAVATDAAGNASTATAPIKVTVQ